MLQNTCVDHMRSCVDFMDIIMGDISFHRPNTLRDFSTDVTNMQIANSQGTSSNKARTMCVFSRRVLVGLRNSSPQTPNRGYMH